MTTTSIKQPTIRQKIVSKPVTRAIKLDLDQILDELWNQGLPNGILNGL